MDEKVGTDIAHNSVFQVARPATDYVDFQELHKRYGDVPRGRGNFGLIHGLFESQATLVPDAGVGS
jgi:hypothetical protein